MDILKNHGLKTTKTRATILELLEKNSPLSAEQIYENLKNKKIKISSIYRNLSTFLEEGLILKSVGMDNISYYQLNSIHHKHQLICTNCKKTIIIDDCPIHKIEHDLEKNTGFKITSHSFEFSGICKDCQNDIK